MQVIVTRHAERRMRERLGLPRRAVQRTAERAWLQGADLGVEGGRRIRLWHGARWVFDALPVPELLTVLTGREDDREHAVGHIEHALARGRGADGRAVMRGRRLRHYQRRRQDILARWGCL